MNYVGPFYALAAALILLSFYLPGARWWRKVALVIAVGAFPALMLFYYAFFAGADDFPLFYDIQTNRAAALALYSGDGAVYAVEGAYSFPFPTYFFYWLATGFDAWGKSGFFVAFSLMGAGAWLASLWVLRPFYPAGGEAMLALMLCVPAAQSIGQGQTATFVLLGVALFYHSLRQGRFIFFGGLALALAGMVKPQLALIPVGLLVYVAFRPSVRAAVGRAYLGMAAGLGLFIGATLLLSGGVQASHYAEFFRDVLPNLTPPTTELKVHASPAFLVSVAVMRLTANPALASGLATLTSLFLIAALAWKTAYWAKADYPLGDMAMFWAVWAIFAPQQSWNFYTAWALPAFLLLMKGATQNRLSLLALSLILLNIQVQGTPLAVLGMSLLAYLVWTYKKG